VVLGQKNDLKRCYIYLENKVDMIISKLYGGLGNQLFQYALGRYLSIKHNTTLAFDISILEIN